jgi:hypothetical protein
MRLCQQHVGKQWHRPTAGISSSCLAYLAMSWVSSSSRRRKHHVYGTDVICKVVGFTGSRPVIGNPSTSQGSVTTSPKICVSLFCITKSAKSRAPLRVCFSLCRGRVDLPAAPKLPLAEVSDGPRVLAKNFLPIAASRPQRTANRAVGSTQLSLLTPVGTTP